MSTAEVATIAATLSNDGNLSLADMRIALGGQLGRLDTSVPTEKLLKQLSEAGFSAEEQALILDKVKIDVAEAVKKITADSLVNFFNPLGSHDAALPVPEAKGLVRAYTDKAEFAKDMLAKTATQFGLAKGNRTPVIFPAKEEELGGELMKLTGGEQIVISRRAASWNKAPQEMMTDLIAAIDKNPEARHELFERYVSGTGVTINFAAFGADKDKVQEAFEHTLTQLMKTEVTRTFPAAMYKANAVAPKVYDMSIAAYKPAVLEYEDSLVEVKNKLESLKGNPSEAGEFFFVADKTIEKGNAFGKGINGGVPADKRMLDVMIGIVEGGDFDTNEMGGVKADALARIIDMTYAHDHNVQKSAMEYLKLNGTTRIREANAAIEAYNVGKDEKDFLRALTTSNQAGLAKDADGKIIFNPDSKVLHCRQVLVDIAPFMATEELWRKVDDAFKAADVELLDKLESYVIYFNAEVNRVGKSKEKDFASLNQKVLHDMENIKAKYNPEDLNTWDSADKRLLVNAAWAKKEPQIQDKPEAAEFNAFVDKITTFAMHGNAGGAALSPKSEYDVITLQNLEDLLQAVIDDKIGVLEGGTFSFDLDKAEERLARITDMHNSVDGAINEHYEVEFIGSDLGKRMRKMNTYETVEIMSDIFAGVADWLNNSDPEKFVHIVDPESPFYGMTFAGITKITKNREDTGSADESATNYTLEVELAGGFAFTTNGITSKITRNERGELPDFPQLLTMAMGLRQEGWSYYNINSDDHDMLYKMATALATFGMDFKATGAATLTAEEKAQVEKIRQAALRNEIKPIYEGPEQEILRAIPEAEAGSRTSYIQHRQVVNANFTGAVRTEALANLNKSEQALAREITKLGKMYKEDLRALWEKEAEGRVSKDSFNKTYNAFMSGKVTPDDLRALANLTVRHKNPDLYTFASLNKDLMENPVPRTDTSPEFAAYAAEKKLLAMDMAGKLAPTYPELAKEMEAAANSKLASYDTAIGAMYALVAVNDTAAEGKLSDAELKDQLAKNLAAQEKVGTPEAAFAKYSSFADNMMPTVRAKPEVMTAVHNYKELAANVLTCVRLFPEENAKPVTLMTLNNKVEELAKTMGAEVITSGRLFALDQEAQKQEIAKVATADYGIAADADENTKKLAKMIYVVAANEAVEARAKDKATGENLPSNDLLFEVNKRVSGLLAEVGKELGRDDIGKAVTLKDLDKVVVKVDELDKAMLVTGVKNEKDFDKKVAQFQRLFARGSR